MKVFMVLFNIIYQRDIDLQMDLEITLIIHFSKIDIFLEECHGGHI